MSPEGNRLYPYLHPWMLVRACKPYTENLPAPSSEGQVISEDASAAINKAVNDAVKVISHQREGGLEQRLSSALGDYGAHF